LQLWGICYCKKQISSKVEKYEEIYNDRILKYPDYDGIKFGYILGEKRAFLIQNLCPVIPKYINGKYIDKAKNAPVDIPDNLKKDLNARVRKAIRLYRKGTKIVFPKILAIETTLLEELKTEQEVAITKQE
jgi:hypothetical protein